MYSEITTVFKQFMYIVGSSKTFSVIILVRSVFGRFVEQTQFLKKMAVPW